MFGDFDSGVIFDNLHFLIEGMQTTLILTVIAIGGGLVLGTLLALARLAPFKPLAFVAGTYVNFFRSMPLILVIFQRRLIWSQLAESSTNTPRRFQPSNAAVSNLICIGVISR